eukprot:1050747-Amphidinium_carterae.4
MLGRIVSASASFGKSGWTLNLAPSAGAGALGATPAWGAPSELQNFNAMAPKHITKRHFEVLQITLRNV